MSGQRQGGAGRYGPDRGGLRDDKELQGRALTVERKPPPVEHGKDYNELLRATLAERPAAVAQRKEHMTMIKKPLAYISAAWSGTETENMEAARRYCRAVYEAGFSPICPRLYLPLFIDDAIPREHKDGIDMARDMLRRSHVLIICGGVVDGPEKRDCRCPAA